MSPGGKRTLIYCLLGAMVVVVLLFAWLTTVNWLLAFLIGFVVLILGVGWLLHLGVGNAIELLQRLVWPRGITRDDDRGVEVEIREPDRMPTRFEFGRERKDRIKSQVLPKPGIPLRAAIPLPLMLLVCVVLGVALWYFRVTLPVPVEWAMNLAILLLLFLAFRSFKAGMLRRLSHDVLAINRCASCGYDLTHLPPEADGCTVCPECGAAWRLPDPLPVEGEPEEHTPS